MLYLRKQAEVGESLHIIHPVDAELDTSLNTPPKTTLLYGEKTFKITL